MRQYNVIVLQDTQCVVLVEHELPESLKQFLSDPFWNRRVIVLLGSALRVSDLARAKYASVP